MAISSDISMAIDIQRLQHSAFSEIASRLRRSCIHACGLLGFHSIIEHLPLPLLLSITNVCNQRRFWFYIGYRSWPCVELVNRKSRSSAYWFEALQYVKHQKDSFSTQEMSLLSVELSCGVGFENEGQNDASDALRETPTSMSRCHLQSNDTIMV